ncbi:hypothetical protein VP01_2159g2 [Puccinia sorghi]|uniref:Uncharacterized protein n=1 Tax=Puccinia sorghi TaxID=27349 RepID=A0A0L6V9K9_9BASI|nr:hypothetical protein VP01_2159g2 [Puccinia sorghi]
MIYKVPHSSMQGFTMVNQPQHASGLDPEAQEVQWQRFLGFHKQLVDPKKSFQDFLDVFGFPCSQFQVKKVEEHLDGVEKLSYRVESHGIISFDMVWCGLLNRNATFDSVQLLWDTDSDPDLEARISHLAFSLKYPTLSQGFPSTPHEQRVKALDSSTYQEAEALFVTTALTSDQKDEVAQWERFLELNPALVNPKESFKDLLDTFELEAVKKHLDNLQELCQTSKQPKLKFGITSDPSPISQLAFSQQHPRLSRDREPPYQQRIEALDSSTTEEAEALFPHQPKSETLQSEIVAEGYHRTYLNAKDIVFPILKTLQDYAGAWLPATHVAPYTALYERLLLAILHVVADFFDAQSTMPTSDRMEEWISHSFPQASQDGDPLFWLSVQNKMKTLPMTSENAALHLKDALDRMKSSTRFLEPTNLRLLLAIDEASQLLYSSALLYKETFFRIFRRTLAKIPSKNGVFSILADTTSRVTNFNPPAHLDRSHRPGKIGRKLFAPIYQIPTFDINVSDPPTTWQQLQSAFRLLRYGSPFFGVYTDVGQHKQNPDGIVQDLIHFALEKLLGSTELPTAASSLTDPQAIALLGSTIQPQLYGASHLNAELISSHAAQCMYIDPSRQILTSEYPSQITFSSAANQYLASDEAMLIRCIEVLTFTRRQGHIGPGDIGELVSRIILVRAMQETMKKNQPVGPQKPEDCIMPFGYSVRLSDFLHTLTGLDPKETNLGSIDPANKTKLLDQGQLFWNHFVCIEHTPNSEDLFSHLHRGAAVHCKPNQFGFDQLFPIYLKPTHQNQLNKKHITLCGIQVQNQKQTESLQIDSHKWTPEFAKIDLQEENPYLVLYFSLRAVEKQVIPIPTNSKITAAKAKRRASLAFYSLDAFPFLPEDLKKTLMKLIDAHPSILLLHDKSPAHTKDFVKKGSPLVFSAPNKKRKK